MSRIQKTIAELLWFDSGFDNNHVHPFAADGGTYEAANFESRHNFGAPRSLNLGWCLQSALQARFETVWAEPCSVQLAWEKKERLVPSPYMHTASIWGETKLMKQPNHMQLQIFENQRCHPEFHTMRVTGHNIFGFLRVDFHYKTSQYLFGVS